MEPYSRALLYSLGFSVGGLVLGCVLIGVVLSPILLGPELGWSVTEMLKASLLGLLVAFFAMMFGFLPAVLWVAPIYAWLRRSGYANVLTAAVGGAVPGALILLANREWGIAFLTYGVGVAVCTHLLASLWRVVHARFLAQRHSPGAMVSRP
jgi:hypothetical protein